MNQVNRDAQQSTKEHRDVPYDERRELPIPNTPFYGKIEIGVLKSSPYWNQPVKAPQGAPNVIVILLDDVGFGATETFGGPIRTPTFDRLAAEGLKYTRFHTTAMCAPTRASLLTGHTSHNAAFGAIVEYAMGFPGYTTELPRECATIGKILQYNGYSTAWFGKNHNVPSWESVSGGNNQHWPNNIGFEKFYGFIGADSDQYHPLLFDNFTPILPYENRNDYHLDTDLADQAIAYIRRHQSLSPDKPFFIHYAPGATHAPHHVPEEFWKHYEGCFSHGWDVQRARTHSNQIEMDPPICPSGTPLTCRPDGLPDWENDLNDEEKEVFARMMEVYAGYLQMTDHNIGRVIDTLDELHIAKNTLVVYIAGDNGGSAEGTIQGTTNELAILGNKLEEDFAVLRQAYENDELGTKMHYNHMPAAWAWAMNSPMKWAKRYASHFGGTRNGMVMRYPHGIKCQGEVRTQFHHVMDIVPTILKVAGIPEPTRVDGVLQRPMDGISMDYTWESTEEQTDRAPVLFELLGNRGLYKDGYMWCTTPQVISWLPETNNVNITISDGQIENGLTPESFSTELYHVSGDFSQGNNLLEEPAEACHIEKAAEMESEFYDIARKKNVLPMSCNDAQMQYGQVGMPEIVPGRTIFEYYDGVTRIPEYCAPDITNASFSLVARITVPNFSTPTDLEGVLISLGGRFGGWGLVVIGGKPTWVYRLTQWEGDHIRMEGEVLEPGTCDICVNFTLDDLVPPEERTRAGNVESVMEASQYLLGRGGEFKMNVRPLDIMSPTTYEEQTCRVEKTARSRFTLSETLDVGRETGTPLLDEYEPKMPFKFNGELQKVNIVIHRNQSQREMKLAHIAKIGSLIATE